MIGATILPILLWACHSALGRWATLLLASSVARRNRRRGNRIVPALPVYGADRPLLGHVDRVQDNGLLVGRHFIPGHAIGQMAGQRVVLIQPRS